MSICNSFSNISLSNMEREELSEINNYSSNIYNPSFLKFHGENNDEVKIDNTSYRNFYETNDKTQGIFEKNENQTEIGKNTLNSLYFINKKNRNFSLSNNSILINNTNNLEENNMNNANSNIKINAQINKSYIDEEENLNQTKKIFKVVYPNNNCNINNYRNNNIFISDMLYEDLIDVNKNFKKVTKNLFTTNSKKRKKKTHKRKDNIMKKIKSRFHKFLKNLINEKLKKVGSKHLFAPLPQSFIIDITKVKNKSILDLTLKEIYSKNFSNKDKNKKVENVNYKNNLKVLEYLDKNYEISEKSDFNKIKNMKYYEIYNVFMESIEFKLQIYKLKKEEEDDKYIQIYIIMDKNYINYFRH